MNAILIDDNEKARVALKSDIEDYCTHINIIDEAESVASGYEAIQTLQPDLIFLDIRMTDGTGFDLLEKFSPIDKLPFHIIFTTAYDEFAIKAFKYAAVDYLLKPIDSDSLVDATNRVKDLVKPKANVQIDLLLKQLTQPKLTKLSLADAERIHIVPVEDIVSCEAYKNYTTFFLLDGKKITVSKSIKEYDELLTDNHFLRVHHSHLVNLNQIKEVIKVDGPYLLMKNDKTVPVSARKKDVLYKKMKEMW